ncbi:uncharacterized protein LOC128880121 [Hylaeus volcanicus]|uniref:uncharacterized protein LOC128880121 n=1 Tax=Hylaeus volcanicus TaxID=313075 RepID=UPI0023B7C243|nr:uncharacterized protein LOC128880121 [Hylaeus volcanicus]
MKTIFLGLCLLCLSGSRVQSKPQITKLFPVQEAIEYHQRTNEMKPLDRFLGKLRATYDFVFRKPENTSNVEKILATDTSSERSRQTERTFLSDDDWVNDIQPLDRLEPLEPLDLEEETQDKNLQVEFITPKPSFQFPVTLSRHLVDWLGSLLGVTYGVYSKLARAIYSNNTIVNN